MLNPLEGGGATVATSSSSSVSEEPHACSGLPTAARTTTKKRFADRWSLRHLIYSSPILSRRRGGGQPGAAPSGPSKIHKNSKDVPDGKSGTTKVHHVEVHQSTSRSAAQTTEKRKSHAPAKKWECPVCLLELPMERFCELAACGHRACDSCFKEYLRVEITESRVCINCPECFEPMHPNEIQKILDNPRLYTKYEDFMVRRVLLVDPDTRWCPAPDCGFAVIASECASCPKLRCERPGCDSYFCYHCKAEWHPNQTCDAARAQRSPNIRSSSIAYSQDSQHRDDIKPCPRCQVLIVKMDDGSCNHMMCAVCGAEFCWLCMNEINDLHFLSPSGCTFWGKKPWSRKKKILWQLGTLVGAPVGIALVAGITVPAMIIGIPVWVGRKLYTRYKQANRHKRNLAIVSGVIASVLISPVLAGLAVGIGVPILLFYVYGVVPVSLCRSGGCGGSNQPDDTTSVVMSTRAADTSSIDAMSTKGPANNPSIGEASLSMASGSQVLREPDRESASIVALSGSVGDKRANRRASLSSLTESANDDAGASIRALAGSIVNYKPGSDSCSCLTAEDCLANSEKLSIGSGCSFRRCTTSNKVQAKLSYDALSNDSIYIDMEERPGRKYASQSALLRSQFFHSINSSGDGDSRTIIEVSADKDKLAKFDGLDNDGTQL